MGNYDKKFLDELRQLYDEWEKRHQEEFKAERKKEFRTQDSGFPVKRLYTPLDLEERGFDYVKNLGFPGEYPYTRGLTSTMYRGMPWGITQYFGRPTPEECNKLWKSQVAAGARMVSAAYDLPSQLGFDPDHPRAEGEVGRIGASMCSQKDWEIGLDGIDLKTVGMYGAFNAPAIISLAAHINIGEAQGIEQKDLPGLLQNDILKEFTARGNYIFPVKESMRLTGDILYYTGTNMPKYGAMTVCQAHLSERGANSVHEAALGISEAIAFIQTAVDMGVHADVVAPGITFLTAGRHWRFFEEIAKHRAQRRIYSRVLKERFGAQKPTSQMYRIYQAQGGLDLHREQYLTNLGRSAIAALAGAMFGAQLIDLRCFDEQFGIPTDEATLYSIRTNNMVLRETGVADTVDPLAGSYFVESLTSEMEERICEELDEIDKRGGIIRCIETGYVQRMLSQDAYEYQKKIESAELERVGFNVVRSEQEESLPARVYRSDPQVEGQRRKQVIELKKNRDNAKVKKALDELKLAAKTEAKPENCLIPPMREVCAAYATVGEICDALREVWGEYKEPAIF